MGSPGKEEWLDSLPRSLVSPSLLSCVYWATAFNATDTLDRVQTPHFKPVGKTFPNIHYHPSQLLDFLSPPPQKKWAIPKFFRPHSVPVVTSRYTKAADLQSLCALTGSFKTANFVVLVVVVSRMMSIIICAAKHTQSGLVIVWEKREKQPSFFKNQGGSAIGEENGTLHPIFTHRLKPLIVVTRGDDLRNPIVLQLFNRLPTRFQTAKLGLQHSVRRGSTKWRGVNYVISYWTRSFRESLKIKKPQQNQLFNRLHADGYQWANLGLQHSDQSGH